MAHKLARLIYRTIKFGTEYVDKGMATYESKYRQEQMKWLAKQAASLNCNSFLPTRLPVEFLETICLKTGGESNMRGRDLR